MTINNVDRHCLYVVKINENIGKTETNYISI